MCAENPGIMLAPHLALNVMVATSGTISNVLVLQINTSKGGKELSTIVKHVKVGFQI